MNINHLYYFVKLAELEHYTNAADALYISQPSLSHAMSTLEKEIGAALFEKQGRNVVLTKYGKLFLKYVKESLGTLEAGVKKTRGMAQGQNGYIDLAFIYTLGPKYIPEIVGRFLRENPDKDIKFGFHSDNTTNIIEGLKSEKFDVAFCSMREDEDEIEFIPALKDELVLIVPSGHPLADREEIDLKETVGYAFIAFTKTSGLRPVIDDLFASIDIEPDTVFEIEEDGAVAGLVAEGFGISIIPNIPILENMNLKRIKIINPPYNRLIYMAFMKGKYLQPVVHSFKEFVIEQTDLD